MDMAEISEREIEDARRAGSVGYLGRLLVQVTLPHSKPPSGCTSYERRNGFISLEVLAPSRVGLPYGTYPRLLLSWITTEAVLTKRPELDLGDSLSAFMTRLGLIPSGGRWGSIARLRDHCSRLFSSTISWTYERSKDGAWIHAGVKPVEYAQMFWDPAKPGQLALSGPFRPFIRLSSSFFEEIITRPVPLDMRVLQRLAQMRCPLAIDIYSWLSYRVSYLQNPVDIPWKWLAWQFGSDYAEIRYFRRQFIHWLRIVKEAAQWTDLNVEPQKDVLRLKPSLPHVLPRQLV